MAVCVNERGQPLYVCGGENVVLQCISVHLFIHTSSCMFHTPPPPPSQGSPPCPPSTATAPPPAPPPPSITPPQLPAHTMHAHTHHTHHTYVIDIATAQREGAGGAMHVSLVLHGTLGDTGPLLLQGPGTPGAVCITPGAVCTTGAFCTTPGAVCTTGTFNTGGVDRFTTTAPPVGVLHRATLVVHMQGGVRWLPREVRVTNTTTNSTRHFPCNQWFDALHQHGHPSLALYPVDHAVDYAMVGAAVQIYKVCAQGNAVLVCVQHVC